MAFQIRISPEVLHAAAERERVVAQAVANIKSQLAAMGNDLDNAWDGGASAQAMRTLDSLHGTVGQLCGEVEEDSRRLDAIASAFEELDNVGSPVSIFTPLLRKWDTIVPVMPFIHSLRGNLRIIPDEVRVVAHRSKKIANEAEENAQELREILRTLESSWEGRSYNKFAESTYETINAFNELADRLNEFGEQMLRAADRYEEMDNTLL